jgi:hypothetical protein
MAGRKGKAAHPPPSIGNQIGHDGIVKLSTTAGRARQRSSHAGTHFNRA